MTIETPTPSEMESMIASAKASSNAEMTATAQTPSEPTCPVCEGTGRREVTSFSNPHNTVGVSCIPCKGTGKLEADWKAHAEGLQAEVERLRVDLKLSKQGWENCANMMRAEIVAKEQAERKLAEAVAALRRISKQHDCGCVPCRGQCTSKESLEIIVDGIRELAQNAIDEATK